MTPAAEEVKAFRARLGFTQAELARCLGIPERTLANWEQGHRNPPAYLGRALESVERELAAERQVVNVAEYGAARFTEATHDDH